MKHTAIFFVLHIAITLAVDGDEPYSWISRKNYYYQSLKIKTEGILDNNCRTVLNTLHDGMIELPASDNVLNIASMPVKQELINWWKSIPKPKQMRVDPNLCDAVYAGRYPIFNSTGCQLKGMMHPGAPRCQNEYLKHICDKSRINIDDPRRNAFVLPESDHKKSELPPQPFLLTARNSFISMCGHISSQCGILRTQSNCRGVRDVYDAKKFNLKCPISLQNVSPYNYKIIL